MNLAPRPLFGTINDYVDFYSATRPAEPAATLRDSVITYRELAEAVDEYAHALVAAGIQHGDIVATLSPPHPDFLISFLAAASVGAVWLGLNPRYRQSELDHILADAKPRLIFVRAPIGDGNLDDEIAALEQGGAEYARIISLAGDNGSSSAASRTQFLKAGEGVAPERVQQARAAVRPSDPALIVYTSGTTGKAKGALLPHHGLVLCSRTQVGQWPARPLRVLNNLPINHIGCVGDLCCYALVDGGTIVFMEQFDARGTLETIENQRVTVWGQVPTMFQIALSHPEAQEFDLSSLQLIAWSGASAPRALVERLSQLAPRLATSYGLTETVGSVTYENSDDLDALTNTVGRPHPEYEVRLVQPSGGSPAPGEAGEIQVRGDFIMLGYLNNPEATAEAIDDDGWLRTGDLAIAEENGRLRLIGRLKEVFKSGGYNIYPREIEQVLEDHPAVAMAAVIGVSDHLYGEVGYAYILCDPENRPEQEDLVRFCRERIANYKIPKRFVIAPDLPLLPIGKIDKQALKRAQQLTP